MRKILAALLFSVFLAPASGLADLIEYQGIQIPGLKVEGYIGGDKVKASGYGELRVTWDEKEVLAAYCTNILAYGVGGEYDVQDLTSFDYNTYSNLYQAAWIIDNYSLLGTVEDAYRSTELITAAQSAVWTLMSDWHLTRVYGTAWQRLYVASLYSEMLTEASGVDFSTYTFKNVFSYAVSQEGKQDLLLATSGGAAVPEPSTFLLMGSALTGLWGYLRRRRREKLA